MTTNDELVERCARAAARAYDPGDWMWELAGPVWRRAVRAVFAEVASAPASDAKCVCPRFTDTGGIRIADLACPIHGVGGTEPGDGYWDDAHPVLAEAASETEPRPPVPDQDGEVPERPLRDLVRHLEHDAGMVGKDLDYDLGIACGMRRAASQLSDALDVLARPSGPRLEPEPREEAARRLRATLERVVTAYFDEDDSTDAAIKARDDELDAAIAAARALLAGRPEQEADDARG